jgi:hypothetical protein
MSARLSRPAVAAIRNKAVALQFTLSRWAEWMTAYRTLPPQTYEAPEGFAGMEYLTRAHQAALSAEAALTMVGRGPDVAGNDAATCLRDWLLRFRDGDPAGWADANTVGGWSRNPAAYRTDVLQDELRRLGLIVENLGREITFAPDDGAGTAGAEVIAAVRLEGEPATPPTPPPPEWDFNIPGSFVYKGERHDNLTNQQLEILGAFARARNHTLTHTDLSAYGSSLRLYTYISELNKALRRCWKLSENPIRSIPDAQAYCLHLPS